MLSVTIDPSDISTAAGAPVAGFYYQVSVVPGPSADAILFGPPHVGSIPAAAGHERNTCYVALARVHDGRPADDLPCLLPPLLSHDSLSSDKWEGAARILTSYTPPSDVSCANTVLRITVYEYVTLSTPSEDSLQPGLLVYDPSIAYAVRKNARRNGSLAQPDRMRTSLLTGRRIGNVFVGVDGLWRAFNNNNKTGSGGLDLSFRLALRDANMPGSRVGMDRGFVNVTLKRFGDYKLSDSASIRLARATKSDNSRYDKLFKEARDLYAPYILEYVKPFPDFKLPFKPMRDPGAAAHRFRIDSIGERSLSTRTESRSVISGGDGRAQSSSITLLPDKCDMNDIHMVAPIIDGFPPIPTHLLFARCPPPISTVHSWHEFYFGKWCDAACACFGTNSDNLATAIHTYLDSPRQRYVSIDFLAAMRIVTFLLSYTSTTVKYRADFVVGGKKSTRAVILGEDVATDLATQATASGDCDDSAYACAVVHATLLGGSNIPPSAKTVAWRDRDAMWQNVHATRRFGCWNHAGLDAVQRLLGYYAFLNILGAVTASFPGEDSAPRTKILDMDAAERAFANGTADAAVRHELQRHLYDSLDNRMSSSEAHRWALLVPLARVLDWVVLGAQIEDAAGAKRAAKDEADLASLQTVRVRVPRIALPSTVVDGTAPMDAYCVVGASFWAEPGADREALRRLETRLRFEAVVYRNELGTEWSVCGGMALDGGAYRLLPHEPPLPALRRRQGSQFYSRVIQADAPILSELVNNSKNSSLSTCVFAHGDNASRWGVPMEKVLSPEREDEVLLPILHRITPNLRARANEIGQSIASLLVHSRLGGTSPNDPDIILPDVGNQPYADGDVPSMPDINTFGLSVFRHSVYFINADVATPEDIEAYEKAVAAINDKRTHIQFKQKIYGFGNTVHVIAVTDR